MPSSGSDPRARGVVVGHLTMAAIAWVAAGVVAWLALRTWTGQQLDEWALQQADAVVGSSRPRWFGLVLSALPVVASVMAGAAILTVALRTRRVGSGAVVLGMAVLALASVQVLKLLVLSKPDLGIQEATLNSFPSGHASLAAVAGLAWVLAVPIAARGWTALAGASLTTAIGIITVLSGWHRPADVVAAILITAGWSAIAALLLRPATAPVRSRGPTAPGIAKSSLGVFALGAAVVLGATQVSTQSTAAALVAGLLAIGATALLVFAAIAAASRHP